MLTDIAEFIVKFFVGLFSTSSIPSDYPKTIEFIKGIVWPVIEVDVSRYLGAPEKINVTLPSRLIRKIDDSLVKDKQYKTRSAFLAAGTERLLHF